MASRIWNRSSLSTASRALMRDTLRLGAAIVIRMPMTASTIISSMRVKPFEFGMWDAGCGMVMPDTEYPLLNSPLFSSIPRLLTILMYHPLSLCTLFILHSTFYSFHHVLYFDPSRVVLSLFE